MDEGRKRVLLIAAAILAARKLSQYKGNDRVPATISAIDDAVRWAERIMEAIDRRWPVSGRWKNRVPRGILSVNEAHHQLSQRMKRPGDLAQEKSQGN